MTCRLCGDNYCLFMFLFADIEITGSFANVAFLTGFTAIVFIIGFEGRMFRSFSENNDEIVEFAILFVI